MRWGLQIFPVEVVVLYTLVHQQFWIITESYFWYDTVSAVRMLARFLEIENSFDILFLKLLEDVVFLDEPIA